MLEKLRKMRGTLLGGPYNEDADPTIHLGCMLLSASFDFFEAPLWVHLLATSLLPLSGPG